MAAGETYQALDVLEFTTDAVPSLSGSATAHMLNQCALCVLSSLAQQLASEVGEGKVGQEHAQGEDEGQSQLAYR
jgi:hypothetical protein